MDIGVHMLDMALHLLGEPAVRTATASTYAEFGPRGRGSGAAMAKTGVVEGAFDVEDLATAFLRLDTGATLLLESSWAQWIDQDRCYVTLAGTEGGASLEWGGSPGSSHLLNIWTELQGVPAELHPRIGPDGGHTQCVVDFLAQVRAGASPHAAADIALNRAEVVEACYASAEQHKEVLLGR
jgi:predicted dehydrogenase